MPSRIDTTWFVDRLAERQMSQRGLAKLLKLDSSAVSLMFRGKREMKLTEAAEIAQLIGVPLEDVLAHAGVHEVTKGAKASIWGVIDSSGEVRPLEDAIQVDAPPGLPSGCTAIQSRAGDHTDGWLYFSRMPKTGINPEAVGRFSVVKLRDGVTTLGKVSRSYVPGRFGVDGVLSGQDVELASAEPVLAIVP